MPVRLDTLRPEALTGDLAGFYKLRVGDYRVMYEILKDPGGRGYLKLYGKLGMSWVRFQLRFISVPREPAISRLFRSNAWWTPEPRSASFQPLFWPASESLRTGRSLWS